MLKTKKRNFIGLLLGVLLISAMMASAAPVFAAGISMYVSPASQTVDPGDTFTVSVYIDTDTATRSAQCDVLFDPALVQVNSVSPGTFYSDWATSHGAGTYWQAPTINNTTGIINDAAISLTGASGQGVTGSGTFIVISMTAKTGIEGTSAVTLANTIVGSVTSQTMTHTTVNGEVIVGQPTGPDLIVSDKHEVWIDEGAGTYSVVYTITNQGNAAAAASTIEVDIDGAKTTYACPALDAAASDTQTVGPFTLSGASDVITVTADISGAVTETDEGNNVKQNTLVPGVMIIESNPVGTLIVTIPDSILAWQLNIGDNQKPGTLNVKCNTNWDVTVSDADAATAGHMTEWDGAAYGTQALDSEMVVNCSNESTSVGLEISGLIANGVPAGQQAGNAGEDFALTFNQEVEFDDPVLGGSVYRIVVTFTGSMTF